jgi:hypothetical protein
VKDVLADGAADAESPERRPDGQGYALEVAGRVAVSTGQNSLGGPEEGLVELRSEEGEFSCKHIEELSPEDRMDRIRAELARIEWLLERRSKRSMLRSPYSGQH